MHLKASNPQKQSRREVPGAGEWWGRNGEMPVKGHRVPVTRGIRFGDVMSSMVTTINNTVYLEVMRTVFMFSPAQQNGNYVRSWVG